MKKSLRVVLIPLVITSVLFIAYRIVTACLLDGTGDFQKLYTAYLVLLIATILGMLATVACVLFLIITHRQSYKNWLKSRRK